ncbi:MAG: 23S rRNA (pseudouridine(1915)-N(3))-methyltransferase RlmH [Holosporaceae bacterium]|nr:MAG: 23S rRNA (pseudouridine(1915)-N(3))-methyltransferase RlmH [Holosporaceae bacterium]
MKEIDVKSHEKNYEKHFLEALPKGATLIALDEHGKSLSSPEFARLIEQETLSGINHFVS